jgi:iron complex outermembrane receptor protein
VARSSSYSKFTPRASVRYEVAPRTNLYFTYQQGFRSGAWNASLPAAAANWRDVQQEIVDAFEAGFKTAGNNYRFELSGFYYNYKGLQVSVTQCIGGPPCATVQILDNAPPSKIYGIEGSFEWQPIENFTVRGGATWLHARYGDGFLFTTVGVNPAAIGAGGFADPLKNYLNQTQVQDLSGVRMSRAPDFTANIGLDYNIPQGDGGVRFATNLYYTSKYVLRNPSIWCQVSATQTCAGITTDVQRQQRFLEGPYALLSASVTWTHPSGHYYVKAWGNNLTDHRYRLDANGSATTGTYMPMAEPRTYGATIGAKF